MIKYLVSNRKHISIFLIVLLLTTVGIQLRAKWRVDHELWKDEIYQISPMGGSFLGTIEHSRTNLQFPGDYVLIYPFYKLFGENKWGLAIPHIIITALGFYLLYVLCRKYFKTIWGYLITFTLFTYNYNLIYHAFEIRPYSVMVTLGIAAFLVMQYIFEKEKPSLIIRVLISLFIFTSMLFHLFGILMLGVFYIYHLIFSRKGKSVKVFFLRHLKYYSIGLIVAFPAWYWSAAKGGEVGVSFATQEDTFAFIYKGVVPIFKSVFGNLTGPKRFYLLLSGIFINFFIPHKGWFKQLMFLMIVIIMPIGVILLGCIHFHYWFIQRLFIWTIPLFCFFLGWCWDSSIVYLVERFKQYKRKVSAVIIVSKMLYIL